METELNSERIELVVSRYPSGRLRLEANGLLLTTDAPLELLEEDELLMKGWGENMGMIGQLIKHNIIYPPHRQIHQGYVIMQVCRLKAKI